MWWLGADRLPPPLPEHSGVTVNSSLSGQGHGGILGTKSGASAGGPGQPTTGGEAHWQTGHQANLPAALESDMATCQASISGVIHDDKPQTTECCRTQQPIVKRYLRRLPPERESEPKIPWTRRDDGALRGHVGHDPMPMCLQCARKGVAVLGVVGVQNVQDGTGPGMPACLSVTGSGCKRNQ